MPAKPLRELGYGGVAGTVIALVCAYLMYPSFLEWEKPKETKTVAEKTGSLFGERKFAWVSVAIVLASVGLSLGLTDPFDELSARIRSC